MKSLALLLAAAATLSAQSPPGWHPHEGSRLEYRVDARFGEEPETMPDGWRLGRVSAVATDSEGLVYVFHRGERADPILVFDRDGSFVRSWGRGLFGARHGIRVAPDGHVWVTDYGDHQAFEFTNEGKLLRTFGVKGEPGDDERHFNRPADIGFAPTGEIYVADGYGNSRVVKLSADGKFLKAWGRRGTGPGEFHTVHTIDVAANGTVYVGDRSNSRIQVFDPEGGFLAEWRHVGAPQGISINSKGEIWVLAARDPVENQAYGGLSGRVMRLDPKDGRILASLESPGHGIAAADWGELYVASMSGNVFRWYPGWYDVLKDGTLRER